MARTCYYELLGVERSAAESDLKKAYRQQALIWHPGMSAPQRRPNHGNVEEATRIFAEIKEAYETLSDPHERAWYDNHREQILREDDNVSGVAASYEQTGQATNVSFTPTPALMRFFSVASFCGFGDSPTGFFAVYRDLFAKLRDEELEVYDPDTEDSLDLIRELHFGDAHTLYDEDDARARAQGRPPRRSNGTGSTLRDFYNFWTTFSTRKSFGWFDRYRLSDADNRQIRRLMEKENKRLRDKARREFVETVQNLAAWMKKRDPRYKRFVDERQQQQHARAADRRRRVAEQRAAVIDSAGSYIRQEWEEVDYTSLLDEYLGSDSASESEGASTTSGAAAADADGPPQISAACSPSDDLACAACDKAFKTAAQKANHEQSKKHQKAVRQIRREMLREERRLTREHGNGVPAPAPHYGACSSDNSDYRTASDHSDGSGRVAYRDDEDDVLAQMVRELAMAQAAQGKKAKKTRKHCTQTAAVPMESKLRRLRINKPDAPAQAKRDARVSKL
ncbi:hypothetical protein LPJ61_001220 [Coemansia biformis]|uniref:J domain-containing protein n=1 Tax=Coemansia biformis TaxID=1286918 RepID=A0A9W7YAD7_9FUNG|nr:hypothetical protein LPJ61_001220 [Coemansia biformis]